MDIFNNKLLQHRSNCNDEIDISNHNCNFDIHSDVLEENLIRLK